MYTLFFLLVIVTVRASPTALIIPVNFGVDSVPNITACASANANEPATDRDSCNLRSALAYCASFMNNVQDVCQINITIPTLTMSATLGDLVYSTAGQLQIEGHGSAIIGSGATRLLYMSAPNTSSASSSEMRLSLNHVQCSNFGNSESTLTGGGKRKSEFSGCIRHAFLFSIC